MRSTLAILTTLTLGALLGVASPADCGERAPALKPKTWLNSPTAPSWSDFKGRVILVEKWATWCGPCLRSIPKLKSWHTKYSKQGLTIIGVSDETKAKVEPFMEKQGMNYLIALDDAPQYPTQTIPAAWLIGASGEIVWQGNPLALDVAKIEEELKHVRTLPVFDLDGDLLSIEDKLNRGQYAAGVKALKRYLKKPKSDEGEASAKQALRTITRFGKSKLAQAKKLARAGDYVSANATLALVEKHFKGLDEGDEAKKTLSAWKKDKKIKNELAAAKLLAKAEALLEAGRKKPGLQVLASIRRSKKYAGTAAGKRAAEELKKYGY